MPLEIKELQVKVAIEEANKKTGISAAELQELKNKIIKECLEKVMAKLEHISER